MPYVAALAPNGWKHKHVDSPDWRDTQDDESESSVCSSQRRAAWARLIVRVYEVDPLICDRCGSPMRVLAIITDPQEVKKILHYLVKAG